MLWNLTSCTGTYALMPETNIIAPFLDRAPSLVHLEYLAQVVLNFCQTSYITSITLASQPLRTILWKMQWETRKIGPHICRITGLATRNVTQCGTIILIVTDRCTVHLLTVQYLQVTVTFIWGNFRELKHAVRTPRLIVAERYSRLLLEVAKKLTVWFLTALDPDLLLTVR